MEQQSENKGYDITKGFFKFERRWYGAFKFDNNLSNYVIFWYLVDQCMSFGKNSCTHSIEEIVNDIKYSRKIVMKAIKYLKDNKYINVEHSKYKNKNVYSITDEIISMLYPTDIPKKIDVKTNVAAKVTTNNNSIEKDEFLEKLLNG